MKNSCRLLLTLKRFVESSDCNAMMESGSTTNIRADLTLIEEGMSVKAVNTLGSLKKDRLRFLDYFSAFTPVGFYYKAFHTPK